jgi:hypothetical protein
MRLIFPPRLHPLLLLVFPLVSLVPNSPEAVHSVVGCYHTNRCTEGPCSQGFSSHLCVATLPLSRCGWCLVVSYTPAWMAAAPGPRAVKLAQVMQLALDRTLGALPQETFLGCFPADVRSVFLVRMS